MKLKDIDVFLNTKPSDKENVKYCIIESLYLGSVLVDDRWIQLRMKESRQNSIPTESVLWDMTCAEEQNMVHKNKRQLNEWSDKNGSPMLPLEFHIVQEVLACIEWIDSLLCKEYKNCNGRNKTVIFLRCYNYLL